ncbi:MAG TPA: glycoside hydrolase family 3 N-terminal domain-containing protein [Gammaproteobacteria bacterium]|nr:glycoside hydrolase family 3 N-terminal domain-containing protein [Gammaproteobacteria bacterium]
MTLTEKLGQLTMTSASYTVTGPVLAGDSTESIRSGALGNLLNVVGAKQVHDLQRIAVEESRLGIPLLIAFDVLHGHRTIFPVPLAEASTFDSRTWELTARESAREAAADGIAMTFAPMLDVSRDIRWGRTVEGPGEDPWLAAQIARAKVRGFQGADLASDQAVAATAKHFCAYGAVAGGRDYASVDVSERTLREVYLPAFAAAVREDVAAIMPAFTELAGVPMTANKALLRDYLRGELGFDGVIVSDYNAIAELINHGVAEDIVAAAVLALNAGVDIDMMAGAYRAGLPIALERGLVSMRGIDESVLRVLRLKERLGLFDDPYRRGSTAETPAAIGARERLAREVAAKSLVLLKNSHAALPLAQHARRVCVIGPLADAAHEMRGPWAAAGYEEPSVTVLAGLRAALPNARIEHAAGATIAGTERSGIAAAVDLLRDRPDVVVLCLGEAAEMSGEAASRAFPELPGEQRALAEAVIESARAEEIPVVVVLFCGRPLVVPWLVERADALLVAWFPGKEAGNAIADVLTGRVSPSGRTPISWPRAIGQMPVFASQRASGRPENATDRFTSKYLDLPTSPLFPLGFGLTYGRCSYANLRVAPENASGADVIEVSVDVTNDGAHAAVETVFLFVRDRVATVVRPMLELKGVTKIALQPAETGTARLQLPVTELRFFGLDLRLVLESGEIEILVGPYADPTRLVSSRLTIRA